MQMNAIRIDYIWYYPEKGLKVKDAAIFGPKNSIVRAQRVQETSKDKFIEPLGVWPTDHKEYWLLSNIPPNNIVFPNISVIFVQ